MHHIRIVRSLTVAAAALFVLAQPAGSSNRKITEAVVSTPADYHHEDHPWGKLTWYVSGKLKNSDSMTTGLATIAPGKSNPRHFHPNCDEVLTVLQGHIKHTMNERTVALKAGDTVSIPQGVRHNAVNIGNEPALLAISFSSAWREAVGE